MSRNNSPPQAFYSWYDVDRLVRQIPDRLTAISFRPDVLIGILRGGSIPAVHLSHLLGISSFGVLHLQTTTSDEVSATRMPIQVNPSPPLPEMRGKRVLLVDDVSNTGATIQTAKRILEKSYPAAVLSAVLVWDRLAPDGGQIDTPTCDVWIEAVRAWVVLPWNH